MKKQEFLKGLVYLVGAGPGDPGLLTIKGMECLKKAQVVVYDYLSAPSLLGFAPHDAEIIYVGKSASQHTLEQHEINNLLVEKGLAGKIVVRLKGGDPFVFGRGGEECEALLKANIPFEIVPGVTAGIAAPAYAGIPVTQRKVASSVAFVTGNEDPTKPSSTIRWEHLATGVDTIVFYMGVGNLPAITFELVKHGRPPATPVAVIRWGTKAAQSTVTATLATIVDAVRRANLQPPAITVVGEVVSLRENLRWFDTKPLFGKRIVITRTRKQSSELSRALNDLGADVIELPTIEIQPLIDEGSAMAREIANLASYDWLMFTSPNGVEVFFEQLLSLHKDVRSLGTIRLASIGPATTKAVERYHVKVDVTAEDAVAEGLVESLKSVGPWEGVRVLIPRAEQARDVLPTTLASWGAAVTVAAAYRTVAPREADPAVLDVVRSGQFDLVTFTSSSTFDHFVSLVGRQEFSRLRSSLKAASIGPVTTETMKKAGVEPVVEASEHTITGLVSVIKEYLKQ